MTQRTELFLHMTQRIDFFQYGTKKLNFFVECDSKNWTFFFNVILRVFFFFTKMTLSILPFLKIWLKNWTLFWKTMTHRIEPFLLIWLTEWNPSFQFDSKNWILFKNITQRTETFSTYDSKNWTFFINRTFSIWLKRIKFFNMFWRVEPFFGMTSRMDFFGKVSQIFEPFLNMTQRIDFFSYDSNNWALFLKLAHRIEFFESFKYWVFFFEKKKTQRIERIEPFLDITQRIEFFLLNIWLKELNFFSQFDSKNCSFFFFMIQILGPFSHQRIEPSSLRDSNTWTFLKIFDSKKWTLFFRTQSFFINKKNSQNWIFESDPQNWYIFWIEPFNFLNMTQRIEPFNFLNMTQRFEPFFQNITQRIELFDEYDSKN